MPIDTEAEFTEMYLAHYEDLLRFVRRRAHPMKADDIVAETFLTAWRRRRELPREPKPWLFRTARNVLLNDGRGVRRQSSLTVRIQQHTAISPREIAIDVMAQVDDQLELAQAWQALSSADQEVLALHVWEQLNAREAAQVLGCSRAAYAMRLTRAKRRLAQQLGAARAVDPELAATR
jgi:RNA polymerase sigma-70 factor (ECF subfamily)